MKRRRPNPRLAKIHRIYSVEAAASMYGVHRNTVRAWIKGGLPKIDKRRPILIRGRDLVAFLQARRAKGKRPCQPGEIYCVRCRAPKVPGGGMVECESLTETVGNLIGICPDCHSIINRRVSLAKLPQILGQMAVTTPQAQSHISESPNPSVNSDLR
ncbi:MAG: hypothetical protein A3H35_08415 [Betaproteobacteria bacterium RIFCSPLOWO2_02_FULL_62_17]|nr:MAG: hypothetical protein A3H35_08415 [Betaproteobacteria bacterium RIFCSPLOWO2_02_FULL_62_17]